MKIRYPTQDEIKACEKNIYGNIEETLDLPEENDTKFARYFTEHMNKISSSLTEDRCKVTTIYTLTYEATKDAFSELYNELSKEYDYQNEDQWDNLVRKKSAYEQAKVFSTISYGMPKDLKEIASIQILRNWLVHNVEAIDTWKYNPEEYEFYNHLQQVGLDQYDDLYDFLLKYHLACTGYFDSIRHCIRCRHVKDEFLVQE